MDIWELIKQFYSKKKVDWVNQEDNLYSPEYKRKHYGAELKPPYTPEELNGCTMPESLYLYLTKVSREMFVSYYPCVITPFNVQGECKFPEASTYETIDYDSDNDLMTFDDGLVTSEHDSYPICSDDGLVTIGEGGCSFSDYIVVKGNQVGSVWNSDGDNYYRQHKNLYEYILKKPLEKMYPDHDVQLSFN